MRLIPKGMTAGNLAIGAGIVILAPIALPIIGSIARPVVKSVIKGALVTYQGAKVAIAEVKESLEDMTAEAKAEISAGDAAQE